MRNKWTFLPALVIVVSGLCVTGCQQNTGNPEKEADLMLYNGFIYPVIGQPIAQGAVVIRDGKIIALGADQDILAIWKDKTANALDCHGAFVMPGFIEGHGHFKGLGENLLHLDLLGTHQWAEIVDSVASRAQHSKRGEWIVGRGWHQEKWNVAVEHNVNGYPYNDALSKVSPDHPVMLFHASGHALMANQAAMEIAGITKETPDPAGGRIVRDASGTAIGVFEENAMDLIWKPYQEYIDRKPAEEKKADWYQAISRAQPHCLSYGITTFEDAGATDEDLRRYRLMAEHDSLDIRLWAMLREPLDALKEHISGYPVIRAGKDMFTCRAVKAYMDGALGSFGAWLLEPYADKPGFTGQNTTPVEEIRAIATLAMDHGMQMCVHAIGDRGNREVLNIYQEVMSGHPEQKDLRWRIEHAQHLSPEDMPRFKQLGVIASMQAIHCTSDAPFVIKRLGEKRASEGAYAWRSLLDLGVALANGTDTPVERVDPFANLYASVTRKRPESHEAFFEKQAMTREEALYSYTMGNAYAAFEDDIKGSLEPGKWADIVMLSQNLLQCPADSILQCKVEMTMVGGAIKYKAEK